MSGKMKWLSGTHTVPFWYWLLGILFVVAFVLRLQGVTQWPMPFHPMLQYENALNVRYMTLAMQGDAISTVEKQWVQGYGGRSKGIPVIEVLTMSTCRMFNLDWMWVSGVFNSLAWLGASWFLFHIVYQQLYSSFAAFSAVCFFLLHPFTIVVSRSFQHESMLMLGFMVAWWLLATNDFCTYSRKKLLKCIIMGVLLCCKPGISWIPLCFVHLAYSVQRHGLGKAFRSPMFYFVPVSTFIPSLLWMMFLLPGDETHQWKWSLLLTSYWYILTWQNIMTVVGWFPILITLVVTIWNASQRRWFNLFIVMGYLTYAGVFSYANMTHDYYLLVLFPLVALSWGEFLLWFMPVYKIVIRGKQRDDSSNTISARMFERRYEAYALIAVVTLLLTNLRNNYTALVAAGPYSPERQVAQELGMQLGMGTQVIALSTEYAMPLRYFSGLHALWWPTQADLWYEGLEGGKILTAEERLNKLLAHSNAQYFITTLEQEFLQQKDLVELLRHYSELAVHPIGVRIFDLKRR